jgi:hypothetical protein
VAVRWVWEQRERASGMEAWQPAPLQSTSSMEEHTHKLAEPWCLGRG